MVSRAFGPITEVATINGGPGHDTIRGGAGTDRLNGDAGDDRFIKILGADDGEDLVDGGDGSDTMEVNGTDAADDLRVTPVQPGLVQVLQGLSTVVARIRTTTETLVVNLLGGNDRFNAASGTVGSEIAITVDGGEGNDELSGGTGNETLRGGNDDDGLRGLGGQ